MTERDDGKCDTCWGSGWLRQFIEPCPDCRGTGQSAAAVLPIPWGQDD